MKIENQLAGRFKLVATNADTGEQRVLADWFDNLILNQGLNRIGSGGVLGFCKVGSGSTAPTVTDTDLQSVVAVQGYTGNSRSVQSSPPYYGYLQLTHRFPAGAAAGNLSEVGVGWASTAGTLFSRALIKDSGGDPTTITVLSNEFLDVTYELRVYPPTTDSTFTATIGGVSHDCVLRASGVTDYYAWGAFIDGNALVYSNPAGGSYAIAYSGDIGAITASPSGTVSGGDTTTNAYSNNSYSRTGYASFGLDIGNFGTGIKSIVFRTMAGQWQCSFTPPIAKDNTKTLRIDVSVSWARKT